MTDGEVAERYQRVFRAGGGTDPKWVFSPLLPFTQGYGGTISTAGQPVRTPASVPQCQRPEMSQRCPISRLKQKFGYNDEAVPTGAHASSAGRGLW